MSNEPEYETAKNWDYLGGIYQQYMRMLSKFDDYYSSICKDAINPKALAEYKSALCTYYLTVMCPFNDYLDIMQEEKIKLSKKDYMDIHNKSSDEVIQMMYAIIDWSQREGVFKLLVEKRDPMRWVEG